tara:strand:- start:96 stop:647 length:552 start_codon:yes stop_codon:yes gene_type:complete
MNTQADYNLMKGVFDNVNSLQPKLGDGKPKEDALKQIRVRLFTINLNLRPLLSYQKLPQDIIDKIHHEALMTELIEKLPAFHERGGNFFKLSLYYGLFVSDVKYREPPVPNFWMDLFKQMKSVAGVERRTVSVSGTQAQYLGYPYKGKYNKKQYLVDVLKMNGVSRVSKKNTVGVLYGCVRRM